jgi:hypothetical protein
MLGQQLLERMQKRFGFGVRLSRRLALLIIFNLRWVQQLWIRVFK